MKEKLNKRELASIAVMLFGLFFGAGNLIFPPTVGQYAGKNILPATIGLLITAVSLPLLGVVAIGISRSEGLIELSGKVGGAYKVFFTCALYLTIGPLFAIPRCAATPFDTGVKQLLGVTEQTQSLYLFLYSLLFFAIVLAFSLFPGKIVTWVGKILTPVFLVFLGVLVIADFVNPMGSISAVEASGKYAAAPFMSGFLEGYNTMDALASLAFGIVVVTAIRNFGVTEPKAVAKSTVKAGIFSCLIMAVIYVLLVIVGVQSRGLFEVCETGGEVFALVSEHYFRKVGTFVLAGIFTFACLKTAIGLVTSCSETFCKLFPKLFGYKVWAVIFSVVSFIIANFGLSSIIAYSVPVLMFLYPLAITLILLGLFGNLFGHNRCVYAFVTGFTLFEAIFDFIKALPGSVTNALHFDKWIPILNKVFPLYEYGVGWLVPALVGLVIGLAVMYATKNTKKAKA